MNIRKRHNGFIQGKQQDSCNIQIGIIVIDDVEFLNGLGLAPDGGTLNVANKPGTQILAYDVAEDETVSNRRDFAAVELAEDSETSEADGMSVDSECNLFVATTQGLGVQVFNSTGEHLGNTGVPTYSNNVSFGGSDGKTLYISSVREL